MSAAPRLRVHSSSSDTEVTRASARLLGSLSGDHVELPVDPRVDVVLGDGCGHPLHAGAVVGLFQLEPDLDRGRETVNVERVRPTACSTCARRSRYSRISPRLGTATWRKASLLRGGRRSSSSSSSARKRSGARCAGKLSQFCLFPDLPRTKLIPPWSMMLRERAVLAPATRWRKHGVARRAAVSERSNP
jgi:hypothetical protein